MNSGNGQNKLHWLTGVLADEKDGTTRICYEIITRVKIAQVVQKKHSHSNN